ncbi:MAG: hypothetical protein GX242_05800, partial [Clostridiales bacterium]|nr:hypothetical protein [Clostridiales bacterium]
NEDYDNLMSFVSCALRGLFNYIIENTYNNVLQDELESAQLKFDLILELVSKDFDLRGVIAKIKDVFNEYALFTSQEESENNATIYKAKVFVHIFGQAPDSTYSDAIEKVTSDTEFYDMLNVFLDIYDDIKTLAGCDYDSNPNEQALNNVNEFIDTYLS